MSPKKILHPYRLAYKQEIPYPTHLLAPSHGSGPRCKVDYNPGDDGPWTTLRIMRVEDNNIDVEEYTCAMPRYYAIPLILINKRLAFYEAQCHPNGAPLRLANGSPCLKQRELREYTYLWKLRCKFLQTVFDMNHERCLDERWMCDRIHGYLHRMYRRYGHDTYQRYAYWRDELKKGRVPYTTPDIADMGAYSFFFPFPPPSHIRQRQTTNVADERAFSSSTLFSSPPFLTDWEKYIIEDVTTRMPLNAFVWSRISQGYSRVVTDEPPHEQWQAWRGGCRESKLLPYRTPSPPPVPELSKESNGQIVEEKERRCRRNVDDSTEAMLVPAAAAEPSIRSATATDGEDEDSTCYEDVLSADLTGPLRYREWPLPFLKSERSRERSQVASASTSDTTCLRSRHVSFTLNAPENMQLSVVRCTFCHVEDASDDFSTHVASLTLIIAF
jgi:hypothetical protein